MERDRPQIDHSHSPPPTSLGPVLSPSSILPPPSAHSRKKNFCACFKSDVVPVFLFLKNCLSAKLCHLQFDQSHTICRRRKPYLWFFLLFGKKNVFFTALSRLEVWVKHIFLSPASRNVVWRFLTLWLKAPGSNVIVITAFYLPNPFIAMGYIFAVYHLLIQNTYVTVSFIPRMQLGVELRNKSLFYRRHSFCSV
jgi:hypothetical protein